MTLIALGQYRSSGLASVAITNNPPSSQDGLSAAHQLRNRAVKAAEVINLRLRAKGFQLAAQLASLNQEGDR